MLLVPIFGVIIFINLLFMMFFGPSEDGFANNLKIPDNINIFEPQEKFSSEFIESNDGFQERLMTALKSPKSDDNNVKADITNLLELQKKTPAVLKQYLTANPAWRVFQERGNIFATRRWMSGNEWSYSLHGYYSSFHDKPENNFQTRLTIGFSATPWANGSTIIRQGETKPVAITSSNQLQQSYCVIKKDNLSVEIFEQSEGQERRLTKASLDYLNEELAPLVKSPKRETIQSILPPGSIKSGKPSIELRKSFQGGIYDSKIWINPGEPGMIYLKAFEVTKGTPLSVERLKEASNEYVGWSENPEQLFFSNTHFTIYEGDWGKYYAARFEIWFIPDSGKPSRKLLENFFKIEGWQR